MYEALASIPSKASGLLKKFESPDDEAIDAQQTLHFDPISFDEPRRQFSAGVRDINKDAAFKGALDLLRNNTTAHHLDGATLDGLIDWKLYTADQASKGISVMGSPIISKSVQFTQAVQVFGQGIVQLVLKT